MLEKTEREIMSTWQGDLSIPLLTVRFTTYNHADYINQSLDGVLSQVTTFPFEIIVHDDASTDGTSDIVRAYAAKYPSIIVPIIQQENQHRLHNRGMWKAINPRIRGKYLAICEGDDYWTDPEKLQRQVSYMEEHPTCTMVCHPVDYLQDGEIVKNDRHYDAETDVPAETVIKGGGLFFGTASVCCRTDLFLTYPAWRLKSQVADYPLQIQAAISGEVHYLPETMAVYRYMAPGSWTQRQTISETKAKRMENEIEWLTMLNQETEGKYAASIQQRIGRFALRLFKDGFWDYQKAKAEITGMAPGREKTVYTLSLLKNAAFKKQRNG